MSRETWEMIQNMEAEDVELQLALQCAPLIAGLKISNLLMIHPDGMRSLENMISDSSISCYPLLLQEHKLTLLLYRRDALEAYLAEDGVKEFLTELGYESFELQTILAGFREKYIAHGEKRGTFPHEMGILLGYPLEDVRGFMIHGGKNYLCSGYWKVYADKEPKKKLFQKLDNAMEHLVQLLSYGEKMADIIHVSGNEKYYIGGEKWIRFQ